MILLFFMPFDLSCVKPILQTLLQETIIASAWKFHALQKPLPGDPQTTPRIGTMPKPTLKCLGLETQLWAAPLLQCTLVCHCVVYTCVYADTVSLCACTHLSMLGMNVFWVQWVLIYPTPSVSLKTWWINQMSDKKGIYTIVCSTFCSPDFQSYKLVPR